MAKSEKEKRKRQKHYESKLAVDATFGELVRIAVSDPPEKTKPAPKQVKKKK